MVELWLVLALLAAIYAVVRRSMAAAGIAVAALIAAVAAFLPLAVGWQLVAFVAIALLAYLFGDVVSEEIQNDKICICVRVLNG